MKKIMVLILSICFIITGCSAEKKLNYDSETEKYIEGCVNLYEYYDAKLCRFAFETEEIGAEQLTIKALFFNNGEIIEDYTYEEIYNLIDDKGKIWIELNDPDGELFKVSYCATNGTAMLTKSSSPMNEYGENKYKKCYGAVADDEIEIIKGKEFPLYAEIYTNAVEPIEFTVDDIYNKNSLEDIPFYYIIVCEFD